ncbi:unnamed protein product [Dibothriocephalus latus]|uniref:Uncharacterized protein n=1 Tax=Dibothriocephalus latus TaxID=60516 RepID=A0A3P6TVD5_DIBLA|nr:unnamed protein product [Dibothriocephalus latus]
MLASALEDMLSQANLQSNPDLVALCNGSTDFAVPITCTEPLSLADLTNDETTLVEQAAASL